MKKSYQLEMSGHQCGVRQGYVFELGNIIVLRSYCTIVCFINKRTKKAYIRDYYSITTARHINRFLADNGYKPIYKRDYRKYPYKGSWKKLVFRIIDEFSTYAL